MIFLVNNVGAQKGGAKGAMRKGGKGGGGRQSGGGSRHTDDAEDSKMNIDLMLFKLIFF